MYTYEFCCSAWEQLWWRWLEEVKHRVRTLLRTVGREQCKKDEFALYALTPSPDDGAALFLFPQTFDLGDPDGYFQSVQVARRTTQARRLWWAGANKQQLRGPRAGGEEPSPTPAGAQELHAGAGEKPPPSDPALRMVGANG